MGLSHRNPFLGDDETRSVCKPVWSASPLSVRQAGEGKSFGAMGGRYVDWFGSGEGQSHVLLIPSPLCGYQDSEALMKSVRLLQALAQYPNHLQEQPQKALVDILSEVRTYQPWDRG